MYFAFTHLSYGFHFSFHLLSSTFVQTSVFHSGLLSRLLSWAFPTSDHHSYWTHNSYSVATAFSKLSSGK